MSVSLVTHSLHRSGFLHFFWICLLLYGSGERSFLNRLGHVVLFALSSSKAELLPFVIKAQALRVLIQASEASGLLIWLDALHFDYLCARQNIGEFDGSTVFFLVLNDLRNALLD